MTLLIHYNPQVSMHLYLVLGSPQPKTTNNWQTLCPATGHFHGLWQLHGLLQGSIYNMYGPGSHNEATTSLQKGDNLS